MWLLVLLAFSLCQNAVSDDAATTSDSDFGEFEDEFGDDFDIPDVSRERDRLRRYNRFMFSVNDRIYFWVLKPVAQMYGGCVPEKIRLSIQRCYKNLAFPSRFVNSGLQGKFKGAGIELTRFGINSTLGILGLFDPADSLFHLRFPEEDFGQTLGRYGIGEGLPLVLPLFGQTNLRDLTGMIPDYFLHPLSYVDPIEVAIGIRSFEKENWISLHLGEYDILKKDALDPYAMIRDAYRQKRNADIKE